MSIAKKLTVSLLVSAVIPLAAQVPVYKTADLLHRISNPDSVYVVNFWATWCKPCVKELPSFDSLHTAGQPANLSVILVSLDFSEDLSSRVVPFLRNKKVQSPCVLLDEVNGNDFIDRIDPSWSGAIPATLVKKGDHRVFAERPLNFSELKALVGDVGRGK